MNNATLATLTVEHDSLRAAFIRYIVLGQFYNCGCNPDYFKAHLEKLLDALHGGAMEVVISELSVSIEDRVFDVLNACEAFQTQAE